MDFDTRADRAVAAADRGDYTSATNTVIDLIAEDWNNAEAHRAWGLVLLAQDKATDAVSAFRTAMQIDPRRTDLHFDLARALLSEAEKNPYFPLANWIETRETILEGLRRSPGDKAGLKLLNHVEQHKRRITA